MNQNVSKALDNIDMTYDELIDIANDTCRDVVGDLDNMMQSAYDNIENLNNESIRSLLLRLSLRSYSFAEIKEKAQFKAVLGEALRKEAYAKNFNTAEGTVAVRENLSIINTASEILAEEIYSLVANIFKIKLDETHRAVDALKSVLMSRMQEAKMASVDGFVGDN